MKLLLSFVLILFLNINHSHSSPNGKGLICKCLRCSLIGTDNPKNEYQIGAYLFENNLISNYEMYAHLDKMHFNEFYKKTPFSTDSDFIKWWVYDSSWIHKLNRNNLILEYYPLRGDAKTIKASTSIYQCSVHSKNEFWPKLKGLKKSLQKKIINKLKDKKI